MIAADRPVFFAMLKTNADIYSKRIANDAADLYWEDLAKYSLAEVREAFRLHRQKAGEGKFMPKPADLIDAIDGQKKRVSLTGNDQCQFMEAGQRCQRPPTVSNQLRGPFEWCSHHSWGKGKT